MYKSLDPAIRVVILKALCDIRVEVLLLLYANLLAVEMELPLCYQCSYDCLENKIVITVTVFMGFVYFHSKRISGATLRIH